MVRVLTFSSIHFFPVYLSNTVDSIRKEAIHEIGHILGLTHCKEPCVMAYSNSLPEVMRKSDELCEKCRRRLRKLTGKHDTSVQK